MSFRGTILGLLALAHLCVLPDHLRADISPEMYVKLKREAPEVLLIRITKVTRTRSDNSGVWDVNCVALIAAVDGSESGYRAGDSVRFLSYYVPPAVRRNGFVGPPSPPSLQVGWEGRVYLTPNEFGEGLRVAVYGQSFERFSVGRVPAPQVRRTLSSNDKIAVSTGSIDVHDGEYSDLTVQSLTKANSLFKNKQSASDPFYRQLQAAAGEFSRLEVSDKEVEPQWTTVMLQTRRTGMDAFRFTSPLDEPANLVWSFVVPANRQGSWYILPRDGRMTGFRNFFTWWNVRVEGTALPENNALVLQTLDGGEILPGKEYIIWFADRSESDQPFVLQLMLQLVPDGCVSDLDTPGEIARQLGINAWSPLE